MKKNQFIIKALAAVMVFTMGASYNADAQLGGLVNKAKGKVNQGKGQAAQQVDLFKLQIPQPQEGATPTMINTKGGRAVCMWEPDKLELTFLEERAGNANGAVYKLDPATGKFTDSNGNPKGSISNSGAIETPNFGSFMLEPDTDGKHKYYIHWEDTYPGYIDKNYAVTSRELKDGVTTPWDICYSDDKTLNPLLITYVCFTIWTQSEMDIYRFGYDRKKVYTSDELDDLIEWNDQESINKIMQFESSRPYAGFKETHPEFKNCKIGGIGLMEQAWHDGNNWYYIDYWVVYELADGRNIVTFSTARKKFRYGDVEERYRENEKRFHEVSDWQRK